MLKTRWMEYYQVKAGQTLAEIAAYFSVSAFLLAKINGLENEPFVGEILEIPKEKGNAYIVCEGDTKELLCGSADNFFKKNGTEVFYIGMRVIV